jgi:hypothetical protein
MKISATKKQAQPPIMCAGGTSEKRTFHPMVMKWKKALPPETCSITPLSFLVGWSIIAFLNCCPKVFCSYSLIFSNKLCKAFA